jgi:cell division protein FtsI (penicillin-binding protein 3)
VVDGRYSKHKILNTFTAVLPADQPRYLILIMLDEPQPTPESNGNATAGWNAAPTAGKVIARVAPMLGLEPRYDLLPSERLLLARGGR